MFASSAKAGPTLEYNVAAQRCKNSSFLSGALVTKKKFVKERHLGILRLTTAEFANTASWLDIFILTCD
jgi:hypothetical protein